MLIRSWSLDDITILDVDGRLGVENGPALRDAVTRAVAGGARRIVLNLSGVTALDAAAVGELARAFTFVRQAAGELKLVVRSDAVREILVRTRLLGIVPTYQTEAAAIANFAELLKV